MAITTDPDLTVDLAVLPPADTSTVTELADAYAAQAGPLRTAESWLFKAKRRLSAAVKETGPIPTKDGKVTLEANGYDYTDPRIVEEFPTLGVHVLTITVETLEQAERALSLVCEEIPSAVIDHSTKADGKAVDSLIKQRGEAAKRLMDLCPAKGKLTVKP